MTDPHGQHLTSYPLVSDGIKTFQSNYYGAQSLSLVHRASDTFVAPFVPYARKPYAYVEPYVQHADALADQGLQRVDKTFPIVKDDAQKIGAKTRGLLGLPFDKAAETADYVRGTWGQHYKGFEHPGVVSGGKAAVMTVLSVTGDVAGAISDFLAGKKREAEGAYKEKVHRN